MPFLLEMWHTAAFWQPEVFTMPADEAMTIPEIAHYIPDLSTDVVLVAETPDGRTAGAVWYRFFSADAPGYGYVDDATPEIALAVVAEARGAGVGTALMRAIIETARRGGLSQVSLSVNATNPSRRIYQRCGFVDVSFHDDSYVMLLGL